MLRSWWLFLGVSAVSVSSAAVGCSGGDDNGTGPTNSDGGLLQGSDGSANISDASSGDAVAFDVYVPPTDAGSATFAYKPGWGGATEVDVIGGFGTSDDWDIKNPYLKLVDDGTGNYTGTANLASGTYPYLFHVIGDSASNDPKYDRFTIDPLNVAVAACPTGAPTVKQNPTNPCSQLTVGTADVAPVHVRGNLTVDGAPAVGWLVTIERVEKNLHHFFVNRITAGSDGSFDVIGSAGTYRIDVDLPTALNTNDIDRDPLTLNVVKSANSMAFPIATTDIALGSPDLGFHDYGSFAPTGNGGSLPTDFTFEKGRTAALDVYGGSGKGDTDDAGVIETGDPWFTSDNTSKGKYTYDGGFNSKADTDAAVPGVRYMWGTEEPVDAGAAWKIQSLVFPITWH
jgi:hypothetical protein